ncbi:membrane lipoprotein lipid attachment site-containing protein [Vibrio neptunius]|uniref:Membrane lipoprotein lipid attachment site-containing protein n=1 Tax=Vibrio neptunius TaxID=170651 RepID=A0ABS2ZVC3_9VIBR|nr:membrane lipoprotein lipid attachment site-containing protein [Vibrio neptunius]MBN3491391.1 membrane lipoprotein lipid attachment site-containing protein [Vibrio neptunius]MBN3513867.1 membrane lipoprotein lipid attachment site-containing protein [Vibrio neptunius]MBN3548208.1 membrane lipoprotein lipid attachment site-containing protein [Vibrio neptunius]MBN3576205.1 membrane lipoprotein lipid attachment site-containing protein [Vibrio neptunius]MCH9869869.1 membrane lipoprotein lipid att
MKKIALVALGAVLLAGCSTVPVGWEQRNQATVEEATVRLKSNLWLNKMPTLGEVQDQTLHGSLNLESDKLLPATLEVDSISIKQGEDSWTIDGELLELRTHNQSHWEVAFVWQFAVNADQPVDVAVMLKNGDKVEWLVEKEVAIDTVY